MFLIKFVPSCLPKPGDTKLIFNNTLKNRFLYIILLSHFLLISRSMAGYTRSSTDCEAYFTYSVVEGNPMAIQFWDGSSASLVTYYWEFGDNTTSNDQNPQHLYQEPGIYDVCLYISDATKSCFDVFCMTIKVPVPTDCESSFSYERDGSNLLQYHFQGYTGADVDSLWWDFGDGSTSTLQNPSHTYPDTGTYVVILNAKNTLASGWCWSVFSDTIECNIGPCKSKFEIIPHPINPFIFNFNAVSQGSINSYYWDFGDGRQSFEPNPIHTYNDTGTFVIKMVVSNTLFPEYCNDSSQQTVHIALMPCQSLFSYAQDTTNPLSFSFLNQSSGPGDEWIWTFGDGSSSAEINPIHLYSDTGTFEVCLRIRNNQYPDYCNDILCNPVSIADLNCSASFSYTQDSTDILSVTFSTINLGPANTHVWSFGDDAVSGEISPTHQYSDTGWYEVKHHVENFYFPDYCNATRTDSIYLGFVRYPQADFDVAFDSLSLTPNLFRFTDRSTGTNITNWKWTFGDGTSSEVQHPQHPYNQTATFTVCLKVSDSVPPKYQLNSERCKVIETYRYFDLGGSVYDGLVPINNPDPEGDTAFVTLYRLYSNDNIVPLTSGTFAKLGYYYFQNMLEGNYLVNARLTDFSRQAGKFFPTWKRDALSWSQANPVELNQNLFAQDILLRARPILPTGQCGIDGIVLRVENPAATTGISEPGVTVYLTDLNGNLLNYNTSDVTGRFLFRNLPVGDYLVKADYPGYLSSTETAALTNENPFGGNLRVKVYKENGIGIDAPQKTEGLFVTNNPFGSHLTIYLSEKVTGTSRITLYNALAQPIMVLSTNEQTITIDTESVPSGLYLLQVENQSTITRFKKLLRF